jgi:signal transduction histidine kinase/AraC-like DNA-binding protein
MHILEPQNTGSHWLLFTYLYAHSCRIIKQRLVLQPGLQARLCKRAAGAMQRAGLAGLLRSLLLLGLLLGLAGSAAAQQLPRRQLLGTREGLSHRWAFHAQTDAEGFLWVSTFDGLNRYDGHHFETFRHQPGKPESLLSSLIPHFSIAPDGKVWCISLRGISVLDPVSRRCRHYPLQTLFAQSHLVRLRALHCLPDSSVVLLYEQSGRSRLQHFLPDGQRRSLPGLSLGGEEVKIIGGGRNAHELVLFAEGRYTVVDLYHSRQFAPAAPAGLPAPGEQPGLPTDPQQRFWYYSDGQLKAAALPTDLSRAPDWQWHADPYGHYYLYNNQLHELYELDPCRGHFRLLSDQLDTDYCLSDARGLYWVCSQQGLSKLVAGNSAISTLLSQPFSRQENPPIGLASRDLLELPDGSVLVLNQAGRGQLVGGRGRRPYPRLEAFVRSHRIFSPIRSRDGRVWFCAFYQQRPQLVAYEPAQDRLRLYPTLPLPGATAFEPSNHLLEDRSGRLWLVSNRQLQYFDPQRQRFQRAVQHVGYPHAFYYDPVDDYFYSIDGNQLYVYHCGRQRLVERRCLSFLSDNEILHAREIVRQGDLLWLATTAGLARIDLRSGAERLFTTADGLPGNLIYSLVADGDYLWLGTADGLCRYQPRSGRSLVFSVNDGLAHPEFNTRSKLVARDGRIWMGGLNGLNLFAPRQLDSFELRPPRLQLAAARWSPAEQQHSASAAAPLQLPHNYSSLQFRFFLDDFTQPDGHRFSYRLLPLHRSWTPWQAEPAVTLQGLAAGRYQLQVRGMDERGSHSLGVLSVPFSIRQVWWKQGWAKAGYSLLLLLLGMALFRDLLRRRLERAENSRLRALDALKNKLYANITHEFRTPFTLILGPAERLQQHPLAVSDPGLQKTVSLIQQNARRLLTLVNQILELRKIEVRGLDVRPEPTELMQLLGQLVETFRSAAEDKDIRLQCDCSPAAFHCQLDRDKIHKIVSNLLSNACKFTPVGGEIRLSARVSPLADGQWQLQLLVADSGPGIAPDDLGHIFDPFYQSAHNDPLVQQGSGIGLTLARELSELLGGSLRVKSRQGEGSTFALLLPLQAAEAGAEQPLAAEAVPAVAGGAQPLVLLIEDNTAIAQYTGSCLQPHYRVLYAYEGAEGIRMAQRHCPDLILTDWMMPGQDGLEVLQQLKQDARSSHIPVLLLTARAEVEDRLRGLRAGADAYLSKPFLEEELLLTVGGLLRLRDSLRQRFSLLAVPEPEEAVASPDEVFLAKVRSFFLDNLDNSLLGMEDLYRHVAMSHTQVHRKLMALTGRTPLQLLRELRLQRAQQLLVQGRYNVSEIAERCGFADAAYFSRVFAKTFGVPPSGWRGVG